MTSADYDRTSPETLDQAANLLLEQLNEATAMLAVAETIPRPVEELVDQFDVLLYARHPESGLAGIDPYLAEGLLGGAVVCLKALRDEDPRRGRRELRIGLEQVRQAVRDIIDEWPVSADRPVKPMVRWLVSIISAPQAEIAELLEVSPRTLQRWLSSTDTAEPSGDEAARVMVVARIVEHLRHSFTGPGTLRWFERPHPLLDEKPPRDLLKDPSSFPALVRMAARARSMVAT